MTKQRVTFTLDQALIMKARLAVKEGSVPSLIRLVERGLRTVIREVEARRGQQFRVREVRLTAGRKQRRASGKEKGSRTH